MEQREATSNHTGNESLWKLGQHVVGVWRRSPQRESRGQSPGWGHRASWQGFGVKTLIYNASAGGPIVLHEMTYCLRCFIYAHVYGFTVYMYICSLASAGQHLNIIIRQVHGLCFHPNGISQKND